VRPEAVSAAPLLRSHAFGLRVESERPLVGLPAAASTPQGPATAIEVAEPGTELAGASGAEVRSVRRPDGEVVLAIHRDEGHNYLLQVPGIGAYRVASDGLLITCLPEEGVADWRWQRPIVNQVLPLAATVRGFEVFHAGAVGLDGRAIAMIGHSGAGKSSITLNLLLRGASFLTDDALAIERDGDRLLAHPGAAVSNFPRSERELMDAGEVERLGEIIGGAEAAKSLLAVQREDGPLPLAALYFLRRGSPGTDTGFEPLVEAGASTLLGSAYVLSVRSPERLANQLDLCAAIAATTAIYDVRLPDAVSAREAAVALAEHAAGIPEASP
jgi:hypothetical protein